jgi:putative DNA primase/helicase
VPDDSWEDWATIDPTTYDGPDAPADDPVVAADDSSEGIVPLGYDHGHFFYLSKSARQVFSLSATGHGKNSLMAMASVPHFWERTSFRSDRGGIQWDAATDWLMRECRAVGIYDADRVRGRGAWLDQGRPVLHMGDHLIVGDKRSGLQLEGSRNIYEAAARFSTIGDAQPLTNQQANRLVTICRSLRWERGISGTLLAGFLAIAPICGGLVWRPSIWITGAKGSGKSWAEENVLAPAIGKMALRVLSVTTEPGLRRALGSDARPVLFDEAEQEDAASVARFQAILGLVRQSSSESGGEILKAAQGDGIARFRIRSCFAFSSINVGIIHGADESRITVLAFRKPDALGSAAKRADELKFDELAREVTSTITEAFSASLLARSVMLLPVIRKNAETLARAVSIHLGSRRLGDQLGTLLAGAASLHHSRELTMAEAEEYVQRQQWESEVESDEESDEQKLLSYLTQARVGVSPTNGGRLDVTIGRLIASAAGLDMSINQETAERGLLETGLRYRRGESPDKPEGLFVSTNHPGMKRLLTNTPWSAGWHRALERIPGATKDRGNVRFSFGHQGKAVFLPMEIINPADPGTRKDRKVA